MLLGRLFRHQQDEQQIDRTPVRRIEGYGCREAQKCAGSMLEALDPAVRDRNPLAKAGGEYDFILSPSSPLPPSAGGSRRP